MKHVKLTYYTLENCEIYTGRLLGLLNKEQFCNLIKNTNTLVSKIATGRTVSLDELYTAECEKHRLVIVLKDKTNKKLFITNSIEYISNSILSDDATNIKEINFTDTQDNWLALENVT